MYYFVREGNFFQITVSELALTDFILDCYCCCPMQFLSGLSWQHIRFPRIHRLTLCIRRIPPRFKYHLPHYQPKVPHHHHGNIQRIQNLMGAMFVLLFFSHPSFILSPDFYVRSADFHALVEPYLHHFYLSPAHRHSPSTQTAYPRSSYTAHLLSLLLISFFPLLFIVHLPWFPIREVCLLAELAPFLYMHPYVQALIAVLLPALMDSGFLHRVVKMKERAQQHVLTSSYFMVKQLPARPNN